MFRPGESRVGVLPRTLVPVLGSARTREDRQIHGELEGTRILRSSGATPYRQTVIAINNFNFSFNCMMCVERRGKEERNSQRKRHIWQERNTLDECGSYVCEGVKERKKRLKERREDSQRWPELAALLVPTK